MLRVLCSTHSPLADEIFIMRVRLGRSDMCYSTIVLTGSFMMYGVRVEQSLTFDVSQFAEVACQSMKSMSSCRNCKIIRSSSDYSISRTCLVPRPNIRKNLALKFTEIACHQNGQGCNTALCLQQFSGCVDAQKHGG